ncbi:unnamed protein product [Brachionus calyciflorus]|uniref:Uncharacterized protein n=1 Tax=Brachionus calyciflorus TaxID=104777 RepID=A0A814KQR1_9BILA|nr:unnamed protein product [Brachionus calyciflorus]
MFEMEISDVNGGSKKRRFFERIWSFTLKNKSVFIVLAVAILITVLVLSIVIPITLKKNDFPKSQTTSTSTILVETTEKTNITNSTIQSVITEAITSPSESTQINPTSTSAEERTTTFESTQINTTSTSAEESTATFEFTQITQTFTTTKESINAVNYTETTTIIDASKVTNLISSVVTNEPITEIEATVNDLTSQVDFTTIASSLGETTLLSTDKPKTNY